MQNLNKGVYTNYSTDPDKALFAPTVDDIIDNYSSHDSFQLPQTLDHHTTIDKSISSHNS